MSKFLNIIEAGEICDEFRRLFELEVLLLDLLARGPTHKLLLFIIFWVDNTLSPDGIRMVSGKPSLVDQDFEVESTREKSGSFIWEPEGRRSLVGLCSVKSIGSFSNGDTDSSLGPILDVKLRLSGVASFV